MITQKTTNDKTANYVTLPQSKVRHKFTYLRYNSRLVVCVCYYVTYRTRDRQRQSVVGLVTAGLGIRRCFKYGQRK